MEVEVKDIIEKSLKKAKDHDSLGHVGKAYAYYTVVAELCSPKRAEIEEAFTDVLCEWCMQLELNNRFSDLLLCYKHSLDIYPNNPRMLNNFAAHLLRNNDPMRAIPYLKKALRVDPTFLPAERNLQNAHSMAVARWHFPMLNDKQRNNAFAQAIHKRISEGYDTVLDVGTGTGLLSLYAKDAGAKKIYACEYSTVMVNIAKDVFERNNAKDIKLIPKLSSNLRIPDDIPERLKLIVTETFDAGLFGELIIPSMISAHKNILSKDGMVIPMRATLYMAAVECEYIRYRSSVLFNKIKEECSLSFDNVLIIPDDEYYDTENLENVKINHITEPQVLLHVNFNDIYELQEFAKDGIKAIRCVKCRYDSIIDGLVTWFKLHLDEEIVIDTSEANSCWQLAVFPTIPAVCKEGDNLTIKTEVHNGKLKCSYTLSTFKSDIDSKCTYRLPREIIMFLNDLEYIKSLIQISKSHETRKLNCILDTSPFPIYGLMQLKKNKHSEILYYESSNLILCHLVEQIIKENEIQGTAYAVSDYRQIQHPVDIILFHNFDMKGELKDWGQDSCHELFSYLLKPEGIILPEKVFLMGQLIFSEDLPKIVSVKDANIQWEKNTTNKSNFHKHNEYINIVTNIKNRYSSYKIAEYINEYKIDQIFDLNLSLYSYIPLSEVHTLIEIRENEKTQSVVNFRKIGNNNKQLYPNALICWYKIELTSDHVHYTKRNDSFMNHMALVLEDELQNMIQADNEVKIKIQQVKGLLSQTMLLQLLNLKLKLFYILTRIIFPLLYIIEEFYLY
ncbi:protein arginine N-methyltransferase 9-like isoform X3 [Vespula pensylvanica]|nr:protein arginine N-methyltransferase 9-like isoform X3 [Vespula pensylvanica]XP_043671851.1 protein arginine N-methyltransferase 9-like isoform X3 [Vespula pensylvanica]XP_043671852.1 protein arginine N-methyltransferase 9-like isoform X3 [Vespula pensylvanica]XP_043671853.1 protein arginine N-methyltransferase 9-like isoform X3 [Vespula pensylvanica]